MTEDIKNALFLDINTLKYKIQNKTRGRVRIFLGEFVGDDFNITVDTIQNLESQEQSKLRGYIKSIILSKYSIIF